MSKDPAMLWYWNDWFSATTLYSRFLKGCYMDLLHAQFNNGRLSLEEIKTCLGSDFGTSWPTIQKKFKQDEKSLFFNERLEREKEKRKTFTESRRSNLSKKPHMEHHMEPHMGTHTDSRMENENRNRDQLKEPPKKLFELNTKISLPTNVLEAAELNQVTHTRKKNTQFVKSQWHVFLYERMEDSDIKKRDYKTLQDLTSYFLNWMRSKFPKKGEDEQAVFSSKETVTERKNRLIQEEILNNGR